MTDAPGAPAAPSPAAPQGKHRGGGAQARNPRRRAREFAVQGLYQWLLAGGSAADVLAHLRELDDFERADRAHLDALVHGGIEEAGALDAAIARHVDRPTKQLSPVEHAVLMIGAYELTHCIDVPYRVVINEAVELAKAFGGTDGHKYVNGVLDKTAADLRPVEVAARRAGGEGATRTKPPASTKAPAPSKPPPSPSDPA
ncbi:MAG: transcription antitermination factor NusB [Betaproteobacteria bacterium]|nr:transcription antitermination factor NusB [Betaproteobacteria bacterium]MCC6250341.1 transcription antitermination factor NusB [Rubrivivax sp.]